MTVARLVAAVVTVAVIEGAAGKVEAMAVAVMAVLAVMAVDLVVSPARSHRPQTARQRSGATAPLPSRGRLCARWMATMPSMPASRSSRRQTPP